MEKKDKPSKRKATESELAVAGGVDSEAFDQKVLGDKDGVEVMSDLNEPTMGEKLASLQLVKDSEDVTHDISDSPTPLKPPSVDSVYTLLKQALRADDRVLLMECLNRHDDKVITNSLSMLNPSDVLTLLQSLISLLQLRGSVVGLALPWLKNLLLQHAGSIMAQESSLVALNSLYQLIESRVSTIDNAFRLSSCLNILYAKIVDDGEEDSGAMTPVIFEDNDDSDDEGSLDSMEIGSTEDDKEPEACSGISDNEENGDISN